MNSQILAPQNNFANNSLLIFWQNNLAPTLPFLADYYQLSIPKVQQNLSDIMSAIILQLVNKLTYQPLTNLLPVNQDRTWLLKTQNFDHLPQQINQFSQISQQFFDDKKRYYLILGDLLHKTQLPIEQLAPLFDSSVGLSMLLLKDFCQFIPKENQTHLVAWLKAQPLLLNQQQNLSLQLAVGYQPANITQNLHNDWQVAISKQLTAYQTTEYSTLFSQDYLQKSINNIPNNLSIINKTSNKKPLPKLLQPLQKYWIATATTLSMIVIGGIGLVVNAVTPEKKLTVNQAPVQKYNDVAIMKVASTTETTPPVTTMTLKPVMDKQLKETEKSQLKSVSSVADNTVKNKTTDKQKLSEKPKKENKHLEKNSETKSTHKKANKTNENKTTDKTKKQIKVNKNSESNTEKNTTENKKSTKNIESKKATNNKKSDIKDKQTNSKKDTQKNNNKADKKEAKKDNKKGDN